MTAAAVTVSLGAHLKEIDRDAEARFATNADVEAWAKGERAYLCVTALSGSVVNDAPKPATPAAGEKRAGEQAGVVPNTHELAKRKKQKLNSGGAAAAAAAPFARDVMLVHRAWERPSDVIKTLTVTLAAPDAGVLKKLKLKRGGAETQPSFHGKQGAGTVWLFTAAAKAAVTPPFASAPGAPQDVDILVPGYPTRGTVNRIHPAMVLPLAYGGDGAQLHFLEGAAAAAPTAPPTARRSPTPPRAAVSVAACPDILADLAAVPAPACVTDDQRDHAELMDVRWYTSEASPELDTFRSLKTKPLVKPTGEHAANFTAAECEIEGGLVYAEGGSTLEVVLKKDFDVREVLLKPSHYVEHRETILAYVRRRAAAGDKRKVVVRVVHNTPLLRLLEYKSISGACQIATIARPTTPFPFDPSVKRILVLDGLTNADNTGSLIRSAACFGIQAVILSRNNCSPWARRCVRVSMGHVFTMPVYQIDKDAADSLPDIIRAYRKKNVRTFAAVVQKETERLHEVRPRDSDEGYLVVMGSEFDGVSQPVRDACESELKIDQADDVDSLSVAIATPLLLYHMRILFGVSG
eukprot:TRINITY_DN32253_c0_g1_i1.p1 TRINITY_DN32253_c0_g1~~TRINITY_DN32253_c0_g1_i1.p1  ORF type:complete len:623 (+),score=254.06 TRINITY_DN32253_c0_g1_i1:135-1871(+)